jgi:hypothetical protein
MGGGQVEAGDDQISGLAAALRRDVEDLALYAGLLLNTLSAALPPDHVTVEHSRSLKDRLAGRSPSIVAVSVLLGDRRYSLRRHRVGAPAQALVEHESGGVVLSRAPLPIDDWCRQVAAGLGAMARQNAAAAAALQRFTTPEVL